MSHPPGVFPLLSLPSEVLVMATSYLPAVDILSFRFVCKECEKVANTTIQCFWDSLKINAPAGK